MNKTIYLHLNESNWNFIARATSGNFSSVFQPINYWAVATICPNTRGWTTEQYSILSREPCIHAPEVFYSNSQTNTHREIFVSLMHSNGFDIQGGAEVVITKSFPNFNVHIAGTLATLVADGCRVILSRFMLASWAAYSALFNRAAYRNRNS